MTIKNQTIWHPTSFPPFKYYTGTVFRSPLNNFPTAVLLLVLLAILYHDNYYSHLESGITSPILSGHLIFLLFSWNFNTKSCVIFIGCEDCRQDLQRLETQHILHCPIGLDQDEIVVKSDLFFIIVGPTKNSCRE